MKQAQRAKNLLRAIYGGHYDLGGKGLLNLFAEAKGMPDGSLTNEQVLSFEEIGRAAERLAVYEHYVQAFLAAPEPKEGPKGPPKPISTA